MNNFSSLSKAANYVRDKIMANEIHIDNFVSVENLLPNKQGLSKASLSPKGSLIAFQKDDILVGNIRPYLKKIWKADRTGGCSPDVLVFRSKNHFDPSFLYYCLLRDDFFSHIMRGKKGTKMPRGDKDQILTYPIPDLSYESQRKLGALLETLDRKFELNLKINAELEVLAKTIYDYWFVQFDFPNKNGKPYKASGGKMVWSEKLKREVPEGWEVKKFSDWIQADKNGDWGQETEVGNYTLRVNCVRGTDINGLNGLEQCDPPLRYILAKNSNKILNPFDLIVEISGGSPIQSTGRLAFLTEETLSRFENPLICSNFCKAITLKKPNYIYNFVYYWQLLYRSGVFFGYEGKTSGIKNLLFESFVESHWTVFPDETIAKKFYDLMSGMQKKKQAALKENQKLTELRDWLLPMLMNGQIKIKDAEQELAMAAEPEIKYRK